MIMIETGRVVLRQWRGEDVAPFAEMNRDVEVMEHMMQKISMERHGWFLHPALPEAIGSNRMWSIGLIYENSGGKLQWPVAIKSVPESDGFSVSLAEH